MKARPFKSLAAVSAAAAALPMTGGTAQAVESPPKRDPSLAFAAATWTPKWYFGVEGGALISDYSRTSFPGGLGPAFGKLGEFAEIDRSGSLSPGRNHGWFGALSIGRDIDPIWDWRLAGTFGSFHRNSRSASIDTSFDDVDGFGNSSRSVTESDKFRFWTIDFDLGRKWEQGLWQTRSFAGFRLLGTQQNLNISDSESKGFNVFPDPVAIKLGTDRSTQTRASSHLWTFGPRVGMEGFYGTTVGITGSASAAFLVGWRSSHFTQNRKGVDSIEFCISEVDCIGPFTEPFSDSVNINRNRFVAVGDLAGSLGLAWRPTKTVSFEAGYKLQFFWNAGESFSFANDKALSGNFDQKKDILIQMPYVKAIIVF